MTTGTIWIIAFTISTLIGILGSTTDEMGNEKLHRFFLFGISAIIAFAVCYVGYYVVCDLWTLHKFLQSLQF